RGRRRGAPRPRADAAVLGRAGAARLDADDRGIVPRAGDAGRFVKLRAVRVGLDVGGHADTDHAPGRTRLFLRTPGFLVVERLERALERVARIDRPVDELRRRRVRQGPLPEHFFAALPASAPLRG